MTSATMSVLEHILETEIIKSIYYIKTSIKYPAVVSVVAVCIRMGIGWLPWGSHGIGKYCTEWEWDGNEN